LASILVQYDGEKVKTRNFTGRLRGVAWDRRGSYLTLVGNGGEVNRIHSEGDVRLNTATKHNLRAVSVNPTNDAALVVGNAGTVLAITADGSASKVNTPTFENLRSVRWNRAGTMALIAGNNGVLMKYAEDRVEMIDDGRANLRGISWRENSDDALITSNCFAEEFIPSPNLFTFKIKENVLKPVSEGRSDLIGVDWKPDGEFAVVVGYDVVWHNGFMASYDGTQLSPIKFENERVYPVDVKWEPGRRVAAIVTSVAQLHTGQGRIILWDGKTVKEIYRSDEFFFSHAAWAPAGYKLAAIASTEARTFDC